MVVPILSDCRQRKISLSTIFLLMTSVSFVRKACETRKPCVSTRGRTSISKGVFSCQMTIKV